MLHLDIFLLLMTVTALVCSVLAGSPKPFRDPPRHVLICAAHSDDCVIMGAEYAYGAIKYGLSVRVAYLTCSGPYPEAEISQTRRAEALKAWSTLSVPKENFTFIDLIQSPISGPVKYSDPDVAYAREILTTEILSLPENAAVIIPAQGESHVDHRTVRDVSLQAVVDSKREDLFVYESPEYNSFLSLVHCPKRTIRTVLRHVPLLNRFVRPYAGAPGYVNGTPGLVFRDMPSRLAKKRELLSYFHSQDGDMLLRFFGYKTPYRRLARSDLVSERHTAFCVSVFGNCYDLSALALELTLLGLTFLTAHEVARGLTIALSPAVPVDKGLALLGGLVASAYGVRRFRGTASLESALFAWAATVGLIVGAL
jgi:LmbE family N-acetylglucosaminyl deacetylase